MLLQPRSISEPFDAARLDDLLEKRAASTGKGSARLLWFPTGEVPVRPLMENGRQVATELHIPLIDHDRLLRDVLLAGNELAQAAELVLFDPQLIRPVTERDFGAISEQYTKHARYAGAMAGDAGALGAAYAMPTNLGMQASTKVVLGLIAFFTALYFIIDGVVAALH